LARYAVGVWWGGGFVGGRGGGCPGGVWAGAHPADQTKRHHLVYAACVGGESGATVDSHQRDTGPRRPAGVGVWVAVWVWSRWRASQWGGLVLRCVGAFGPVGLALLSSAPFPLAALVFLGVAILVGSGSWSPSGWGGGGGGVAGGGEGPGEGLGGCAGAVRSRLQPPVPPEPVKDPLAAGLTDQRFTFAKLPPDLEPPPPFL